MVNYHKNNKRKIEILEDDKFIINSLDSDIFRIFQFIENKINNEYYLQQIGKSEEGGNDILIDNKKNIICIKKGYINIYKLLPNYIQLQTKIFIPLISNTSFHKGILMNNKNKILVFEINKNFIKIWNIKNYSLKNKNYIKFKNTYYNKPIITSLDNKDKILFIINKYKHFFK